MNDVNVSFNADVSGYTSSMIDAVAATAKMNEGMTRLSGRIGKLNSLVPTMINQVRGLAKENSIATSQAAAYQQKLAGLEATSKVLSKTTKGTSAEFSELSKTTKKISRDFPVSLDSAVEQVQMLQTSGVTANKSISGLAEAFIKLGAANNTNGAGIGREMLQVARMFGDDSVQRITKLGDSLTTVSAASGASADSVIGFTKALAPIGSTMGMSQTQIMGISAAMSSVGEDGSTAANALNKVMLDMNKSIRDGSPLIREYAHLMGTTVEETRNLFEDNPAEALSKFISSISDAGPHAIRAMEDLGLGGIRSVKALTTLSKADVRGAMATAAAAYGDGSTEEAAKEAFGGVNDSLAKLQETMSQTVVNAGKPFLSLLERAINIGNSFAGVIESITGNNLVQWFTSISGVVVGLITKLTKLGGVLAMLRAGNRWFRNDDGSNIAGSFKMGLSDERDTPGGWRSRDRNREEYKSGMAYRVGTFWGQIGAPTVQGSPLDPLKNAAGRIGRGGMGIAETAMRLSYNQIRDANLDPKITTEGGRQVRGGLGDIRSAFFNNDTGTRRMFDGERFKQGFSELGTGLNKLTNQSNTLSNSFGNMAKAGGRFVVESAKITKEMAVSGARRAAPAVGNAMSSMGIGPGAIAMIAATAAYSRIKSYESEKKEVFDAGWSNGNRGFNEFAEKTGMATKSLLRLSEAAQKTTNDIAAENRSREEALKINSAESRDAAGPNYQRGYDPLGKAGDHEKNAFKARLRFGSDLSNPEIARIMSDVANKFGDANANEVGKSLGDLMGQRGAGIISKGLSMQSDSLDWEMFGGNGKRTNRDVEWIDWDFWNDNPITKLQRSMQGNADSDALAKDVMGETTRYITGLQDLYGKANADMIATKEAEKVWGDLVRAESVDVNVSSSVIEKMIGVSGKTKEIEDFLASARTGSRNRSFEDLMAEVGQTGKWNTAKFGSFDRNEDTSTTMAAKEGDKAYHEATGKMSNFADALDTGRQAALRLGMTVSELASSDKLKDLPEYVRNAVLAEASPDDTAARFRRSRDLMGDAFAGGASPGEAALKMLSVLAEMSTTDVNYEAMAKALELVRQSGNQINIGRSQAEAWSSERTSDMRRIKMYEDSTSPSELVQSEGEAGYAGMQQRRAEIKGFALSFLQAEHEMNRNLARARAAFAIQEERMNRDRGISIFRADRDFKTQMVRAEDDYALQRTRALDDYNRGVIRQNEEFAISAKRQAEQTAKSIASPFEKMAAQQVVDVGLLMDNLKAQSDQAKDQMESIERLRKMGLSKDAVDQLGLLGPNMNSQVQRLLTGALDDPEAIRKLNALVADRIKTGQGIAQNEASKEWEYHVADFKRGQDWSLREFNKSMDRQEKDFAKSMDRSASDFKKSMADASADFEKSLKDAKSDAARQAQLMHEDLAHMLQSVTKNWQDEIDEFTTRLGDLPSKVSPEAVKNVKALVDAMKDAWNKEMGSGWEPVPASGAKPSAPSGSTAVGQGFGSGQSYSGPLAQSEQKGAYFAKTSWSTSGKEGYEGAAAKIAQWGAWGSGYGKSKSYFNGSKDHNGVDIKAAEGSAISTPYGGKVVWVGTPKDTKAPYSSMMAHATSGLPVAWAGNTVVIAFDTSNNVTKYIQFAHMKAFASGIKAGADVKPGEVIGSVGSTGNSTGPHLHISTYEGSRHVDPAKYLAHGGIATRQTNAVIAEAGHPEAVIPLNERGASVLASAMSRYLSNSDAMSVRTQGHCTHITSNTSNYDHSTRVTGPITVQSANPDEMLEKIRQKARRASLVRSR